MLRWHIENNMSSSTLSVSIWNIYTLSENSSILKHKGFTKNSSCITKIKRTYLYQRRLSLLPSWALGLESKEEPIKRVLPCHSNCLLHWRKGHTFNTLPVKRDLRCKLNSRKSIDDSGFEICIRPDF